ncbi:hypothetical protein LOZ52_003271 [Ophidiomyces ophidiicola]|nr:hypothetical protein LOZ62_005827 [Ophidiomyces ophidiicola]KAI1961689.1 hypothetical protein LOZ59_002339 [Ophidiomyces ophidiicola]KAI2002046.1 hypothetical protein LOZ50_005240 [Ophidiomyces ophidiicola]KAI2063444.1 hypothetical protein LOZ40_005431 [Ophidiomyces ophidiicola]KAI2107538.1 hypothetical protein LOZ34_002690 [Ophidiomyces ophidiicola]
MEFDCSRDNYQKQLMEDWARKFDSSLLQIGEMAGKYRQNPRCTLVSKHCGSFNFCVRLHWDDDGPDWLIRFQIPGKTVFADEKLRGEIAVMKLVRRNTSIPVPEIITYGSAAENPTGLGPSIIMTWLEGVRMKELMEKKKLDANTLRTLYSEVSGILYQLWTLEFDKIGSVDFNSDSNSWEVNSRPITLGMNELVRYGGINEENLACGTFESSLDYVFHLCEMRELHFMKQRNSVHDSRDCRAKYTCRRLLKSTATLFTSKRDINGPFKLFCDDLGPGNILVDPITNKVTGVIDWEFCYAAPAQFAASPPPWLLLKPISHWVEDSGLQAFLDVYIPKFNVFLETLQEHETNRPSINTDETLSNRMRNALEDRTVWFNFAIRNGWSTDNLYWNLLDNYVYGTALQTERVARTTGEAHLRNHRETVVRLKILELQQYNREMRQDVHVEYQQEEEDEKAQYWLPPESLCLFPEKYASNLLYRVVIKTRPAECRAPLEVEYREHLRASVSSCQFIRPLLDIIPDVNDSPTRPKYDNNATHKMAASHIPPGLVFQWMDHNLYDFDPRIYRRDYVLAEAVATGVLKALVSFENNNPCTYEVNLSDLGESNYDGFSRTLTGSSLTRAPEVWEGKGHFHSSDIWALGVTLFEQFSHSAFSFSVIRDDVLVETIMLAKIMRLFPEWHPSPVEWMDVYGQSLGQVFADATRIKDSIPIEPLDQ